MHTARHRKATSHKSNGRKPNARKSGPYPSGPPPSGPLPSGTDKARDTSPAPGLLTLDLWPSPPRAFPADLIVPAHRGAVITAAAWPSPPLIPLAVAEADRKVVRRVQIPRAAIPLPARPEPLVAPAPAPAAAPAAASTPTETSPVPRNRALVARRGGMLDAMGSVLRDSGRWLARLAPGHRRAEETRAKLARAEARLLAMEAQLAALQALQEKLKTQS